MRPTRPLVSSLVSTGWHWLPFYLFALLIVSGARADNVTVTAGDSQLAYVGTWVDQDNGGHRYTGEQGASVSLTFQGTAVYWYSDIDPRGAVGKVTVDGGSSATVDLAANATESQTTTSSALMFAKEGLDGSKQHTIKIAYVGAGQFGGPYLSFYYFEYMPSDSAGAGTSPTSSPSGTTIVSQVPTVITSNGQVQTVTVFATFTSAAPTSTTAAPASGGGGGSSSKTVLIGGVVGGVVGGLLAGALVLFFVLCLRRRRRARRHQKAEVDQRTSRPFVLPPPDVLSDKSPSPTASPGPLRSTPRSARSADTSSAPTSARSEEASTLMSALPILQHPPAPTLHPVSVPVRSLSTVLDMSPPTTEPPRAAFVPGEGSRARASQSATLAASHSDDPHGLSAIAHSLPVQQPPSPQMHQRHLPEVPVSEKLAYVEAARARTARSTDEPEPEGAIPPPEIDSGAATSRPEGAGEFSPRPWMEESRPQSLNAPPPMYTERPT